MTAVATTPSQIESQGVRRPPNWWQEEVCRDFGQYILAAAAVPTTGAAIWGWVSYSMANSPLVCVLATILTIAVAAEVFGFFRIRSLKPERDFDTNLNRFDEKTQTLQEENAKLKEEIDAIDITKKALERNFSQQQKKIQSLLDDNKNLVSKIDVLNHSLQETESNLADTEKLYQNLKNTFDRATKTLVDVVHSKEKFDQSEDEISDEVKSLSDDVSSMDGENKEFDGENKELSETINLFHKELEELKNKLTTIQKEKAELTLLVDRLQTNNQKFLEGTSKISKAEQGLKAQNEALEKKLIQLESLLSAYKKAKEEDEKE